MRELNENSRSCIGENLLCKNRCCAMQAFPLIAPLNFPAASQTSLILPQVSHFPFEFSPSNCNIFIIIYQKLCFYSVLLLPVEKTVAKFLIKFSVIFRENLKIFSFQVLKIIRKIIKIKTLKFEFCEAAIIIYHDNKI